MQKWERFVVFDVETPNRLSDRISAIGIAVVQQGKVLERLETLVNPESYFEPMNIRITGITPEMVEDAPTFDVLWPQIRPLMESGLLVAHNAPFDMGVLYRCLRGYGFGWGPVVPYACTCQMARRCFSHLPNHRLDTLCRYLGIELNHHQAGSDSLACAQVLLRCLQGGMELERFVRSYDMVDGCTVKTDVRSGRL